MKTKLSKQQIIYFVRQAVAPYDCEPKFTDYGIWFCVSVYFYHRERIILNDFIKEDIRNPKILERRLMAVRTKLKCEGDCLNHWRGIFLDSFQNRPSLK